MSSHMANGSLMRSVSALRDDGEPGEKERRQLGQIPAPDPAQHQHGCRDQCDQCDPIREIAGQPGHQSRTERDGPGPATRPPRHRERE